MIFDVNQLASTPSGPTRQAVHRHTWEEFTQPRPVQTHSSCARTDLIAEPKQTATVKHIPLYSNTGYPFQNMHWKVVVVNPINKLLSLGNYSTIVGGANDFSEASNRFPWSSNLVPRFALIPLKPQNDQTASHDFPPHARLTKRTQHSQSKGSWVSCGFERPSLSGFRLITGLNHLHGFLFGSAELCCNDRS